MTLYDNTPRQSLDALDNIDDIRLVANKTIGELNHGDLLIFPRNWETNEDAISKLPLFTLEDDETNPTISTGNIMGFFGIGFTTITIKSRFSRNDDKDYFLHYMLQKVNCLNIVDLDTRSSADDIFDFLIYLFPLSLDRALKQGIYKEYKLLKHNDANIKGSIDIPRHIRMNMPFAGKIAYNTREYCIDNPVMQLLRHTIEHIKIKSLGKMILTSTPEVRENVKTIEACTPGYNKNDRQKIINANRRIVRHPYFTAYKDLQKLCLRILRHEKLRFGNDKDKIHGVLFDGAWLWEEYLNTLLKDTFEHPKNKTGKGGRCLFTNEWGQHFQRIYPDFISKSSKPSLVADAKYIPLDDQKEHSQNDERLTSIYYKTIAYMYRLNAPRGFLIYPHEYTELKGIYNVVDTEGQLIKYGFKVPQGTGIWKEYISEMKNSGERLKDFMIRFGGRGRLVGGLTHAERLNI